MKRPVPMVIDFLLGLINFFLNISGISIIVYALIHLMKLKLFGSKKSDDWSDRLLSTCIGCWFDPLDEFDFRYEVHVGLFIYLLVTTGTIFFVTSVCGCIATCTWSPTFLTLYCVFLFGLMVAELGVAAYVFFDHRWKEDLIVNDKSGSLDSIYHFFKTHWAFLRWVLVAALVLQAIGFIMSMYLLNRCNNDEQVEDEETRLVRTTRKALARPRSREQGKTPPVPRPEQARKVMPRKQLNVASPSPTNKLNPPTK